ncbi:hypothetical protein [Paenibacillus tarimensis]|uniref:hypothetical protein n=1 Tax=Paenibacillus tarimensis TaxID=416012 RepID=UPI001F18223D|nr:hypothetical protein [Paenibacillus tarimensis]MCF2945625.1 hypothetical protein [Paenibacillus tarimensis]
MKTRYFNYVEISEDAVSVTKTSDHPSKLIDEIVWYLDLPEDLKTYTPLLQSFSLGKPRAYLTLDYVPGGTLGESLIQGSRTRHEWSGILESLRLVLGSFAAYTGSLSRLHLYTMYIGKTHQRLNTFLLQSEWAREAHKQGYYYLNGRPVMSPTVMLQKGMKELIKLLDNPEITVMHGDFCLSNLFYSAESGSVKAIDPRGRFGIQTIYGDHRYDWAKLRHSLTGYEHIVRGRYEAAIHPGSIELKMKQDPDITWMRNLLDSWMPPQRLRSVRVIEALLFLSMLPLHKEDHMRQLALFAIGTELLEEILEG